MRSEFRSLRQQGVLLLLLSLFSTGCVTTTTGPEPASDEQRLQTRLDLARGYMENGEFERARPALERALKLDPRSAEANVLMGLLSESQKDFALAEKYYKVALSSDPNNPQALNNYASFLFGQERYNEAVKMLKQLVQNAAYRSRSQAYENLGLAELKLGEVPEAEAAFKNALQHSSAQVRSSLELADLAYAQGNYSAAISYYDSFRSQTRQTARSLCLGLKLAQNSGDYDQVASYTLALHNLFPKAPETANCSVPK